MSFDPERADIRFGCGLSPTLAPPGSVAEIMVRLAGPDEAAAQFPISTYENLRPLIHQVVRAQFTNTHAKTQSAREEAQEKLTMLRQNVRKQASTWFGHSLMRRALGADPLRERLAAFWADHFTAVGRNSPTRHAQITYVEEAIRPHVAGRFSDLLKSAVTHPMMLVYLDQHKSIGPGSRAAKRNKNAKRGLNENLARELLELHTLGVGGPYTQVDVRQLAELLTGLSFNFKKGFRFRPGFAEPGAETVLGVRYGGDEAQIEDVHAVLDDLARHPVTATHVAQKLAVHFVSDMPDPVLIEVMADRFRESDGDLSAVCEAMLMHPAAWAGSPSNVKRPVDFIGSAMRALEVQPNHLPMRKPVRMRNLLMAPMALMGQRWGQAQGPDGWPEGDADWITPQRLAARVQWAMNMPAVMQENLPDPRNFVTAALGSLAPEPVRFAASAAESRAEGVGLVLASPAFQRM